MSNDRLLLRAQTLLDERARCAQVLRSEAADFTANYEVDAYDDFAAGYVAGLNHAADLLDGDR